ncbi:MAG: serine hydrolase [Ignavibacteriaceae bacterium]
MEIQINKFCSRVKYFSIIFFLIGVQTAQPQHIKQKLDRYVYEYQKDKDAPSISAGISIRGKTFWLEAQGYADVENHVPVNTKTIYRIASISKIITAVAVMQLVEKHKINLDEDARKYIPYFPKKRWKFTVRQILQHTAGLRNYKEGEFDYKIYFQSTKEAVALIANDSLKFKPGTKFLYTTLGYNLLAAIIENVSGMSFPDYLEKYIFEPAKMYSTKVEYQSDIIPNRAHGYERNGYRELINAPLADLSVKFAGGGLISDSEDLLKFANNLLNGKLIKRYTLDTMLVSTRLKNGQTLDSGLGFEVNKDESGRFYFGHLGGGTGFVSLLIIYPEYYLAAVDLININDRDLGKPALDLASIILNNEYIRPKKSLADRMFQVILSSNVESAFLVYRKIKSDSSTFYNTDRRQFDLLGYDLMSIKRFSDAIKIFNFIATENLKDKSGLIGMGDAYFYSGDKKSGLSNYQKALKIEPNNKYAIDMIKKIKKNK